MKRQAAAAAAAAVAAAVAVGKPLRGKRAPHRLSPRNQVLDLAVLMVLPVCLTAALRTLFMQQWAFLHLPAQTR